MNITWLEIPTGWRWIDGLVGCLQLCPWRWTQDYWERHHASWWSEWDLNPWPSQDFKSGTLTTPPHCLFLVLLLQFLSFESEFCSWGMIAQPVHAWISQEFCSVQVRYSHLAASAQTTGHKQSWKICGEFQFVRNNV